MADNGTSQNAAIAPPLDQLSQLLMNLPRQGSPLDGLKPNPVVMPTLAAPGAPAPGTADLESRLAQPRTMPTAAPPQPSDDPSITSARAGLDTAAAQSQALQARMEATQGKLSAIPPLTPDQLKPKWYDRLLGGVVGGLAGYGDAARGAELGGRVTNRRGIEAQANYTRARSPLLEQLQAEREEIPVLTMGNEAAQRQFTAARDTQSLNQKEELNTIKQDLGDKLADVKKQLADAKDAADTNKQQNALQRLDQLQQDIDRKIDQGQQLQDLRERVSDLKEQAGGKAKPAQSLAVQNKRDASWGRARREYDANVAKLGLSSDQSKLKGEDKAAIKEAQDDYYSKLQDAQDEYEQGIGVIGGSADHVELQRNHFGEQPTAQPSGGGGSAPAGPAAPSKSGAAPAKGDIAPSAAQFKTPGKGLRVQQPNGAIQIWKLEGKTPVLVKEEKGAKP